MDVKETQMRPMGLEEFTYINEWLYLLTSKHSSPIRRIWGIRSWSGTFSVSIIPCKIGLVKFPRNERITLEPAGVGKVPFLEVSYLDVPLEVRING